MQKIIYILIMFFILNIHIFSDYPKLPVFNLKYNTAIGSEEDEELNELLSETMKHSVVFSIREEISKNFYFSVPIQYTFNKYFITNSDYYYLKCTPYLSLDISEILNMKLYFSTKWMDYALLDTAGLSKDYFYFDSKLQFSYKLLENLKFITYLKGAYDLYNNPEKVGHAYDLRLELEAKIAQFIINGSYTGKMRLPLGEESIKTMNFLNTVNISLELDPNRKIKEILTRKNENNR